ncbi:MAG: hypothetical protein HQ591_00750 [candidate division Zixibacteria bacterium]|nr:hypothetical protein [Candidatus Tariuqbacter arcticus]
MQKRIFPVLLIIVALILASCEEDDTVNAPEQVAMSVYVVNSLGCTISQIDLEADTVYNDIYTTGDTPAEIQYSNGLLYLVNSSDNTFQKIDINSGNEYYTEIGDNRNPAFFEFIGGGKAAIANWESGTVSFVNLSSGIVEDEIPVGVGLWGMTYHNGKIYIGITNFDLETFSYGQGRIAVIDAGSQVLEDSIDVGTNPGILFIDHQDELNVICIGDYWSVFAEVWLIDPADNSVIDSYSIGSSPSYEALAEDGMVYLGAGGWIDEGYLLSYDSESEEVIHGGYDPMIIPDEAGAQGVAVDSDGYIYVCCFSNDHVVKMDSDGNVLETYEVGDGPQTLVYVEL